jgi:hypothetical protein
MGGCKQRTVITEQVKISLLLTARLVEKGKVDVNRLRCRHPVVSFFFGLLRLYVPRNDEHIK